METIKVNMNPNPLDVQTIHASQNDSEAREWEFELHNNGDVIDASEISDQLVFKAYKGGTEQLLPENGSTPTTSPFKGDIRYPQGLLADQEFLYRQSPTEEDGYAKIETIYGNTLVWNQLAENGNFADSSNWVAEGEATINSITNNTINVTTTNAGNSGIAQISFPMANGHKYLLVATIKTTGQTNISISGLGGILFNTNSFVTKGGVFTWTASTGSQWSVRIRNFDANSATFEARNVMLFDLTQMGLDITDPSDFTSLFPLSYYSYNQGSLLSFNGNGIKTVGKNLVFKTIPNSSINGSGVIISTSNFQMSVAQVLKGKEYVITTNDNSKKVLGFFYDEPVVGSASYNGERVDDSSSYTFTSPITGYVAFRSLGGYSTPMLEFGSTATSYEPYTSSTLSLPISTYFPTGMKSAGSVYDELTESKAITRIGRVDLGTLDWTISNPSSYVFRGKLANLNAKIPNASDLPNALLANYLPYRYGPISGNNDGYFAIGYRNATDGDVIVIIDHNYSDRESFISHISGQYLFYELATPTETSFTTASLVTENEEIPLSNNDGVLIGKCTEELSAEPGFHDAKIKLSDSDGTCYSNKLQLHVERSPQ